MLSNLKKLSLSLLTIPLFIAPNNVDAKSIDEIVGTKKKENTLKKEQAKKQNYFQWSNSYYQEIKQVFENNQSATNIISILNNSGSNDDFDGDGVLNYLDLDDDNDGILDIDEMNGSISYDFSAEQGWASTGNFSRNNGKKWYQINADNTDESTLEKTYTTAMDLSKVSFAYGWAPAPNSGITLELLIDDVSYAEIVAPSGDSNTTYGTVFATVTYTNGAAGAVTGVPNSQYGNWDRKTIEVTLPEGISATKVTFKATQSDSDGSNVSDFMMTDLQYFQILDTDGDGILNHFDLDSDADNCPDAIEGSGAFKPSDLVSSSIDGGSTSVVDNLGNTVETTDASLLGVPKVNGIAQKQGPAYSVVEMINACIDTDEDGVSDVVDLDTDNDGILDTDEMNNSISYDFSGTQGWASTGNFSRNNSKKWYQINADNTDESTLEKTYATAMDLTRVSLAYGWSPAPNSGTVLELLIDDVSYAKIVTPSGSTSTAYKTVSATVSYNNGAAGIVTEVPNTKYGNWDRETIEVILPAGISATKVTFKATQADSDGAYVSDFMMTDIQYFQPLDTDGDGILNHFDLDSDGDGCSDAIEGNGVFKPSDLAASSMDGGSTSIVDNLGTTVETTDASLLGVPKVNGVAQKQEPAYSIVELVNACIDTDSDGVSDIVDLDDDNDGILDTDEMNDSVSYNFSGTQGWTSTGNFWRNSGKKWYQINADNTDESTLEKTYATAMDLSRVSFAYGWAPASNSGTVLELLIDDVSYAKIVTPSGATNTSYGTVFATVSYNNGAAGAVIKVPNTQYGNWNRETIEVILPAGISATKVTFKATQADSNGSWVSDFMMTDVQYFQPLDTDGDGILNDFDLDSDADNCPDAIEGNGVFKPSDLVTSSINGGSTSIVDNLGITVETTDASLLGVPKVNSIAQPQSPAYSIAELVNACIDTDEDGASDVIDLDDDNDGILDTDEMNSSTSYDFSATQGWASAGNFSHDAGKDWWRINADNTNESTLEKTYATAMDLSRISFAHGWAPAPNSGINLELLINDVSYVKIAMPSGSTSTPYGTLFAEVSYHNGAAGALTKIPNTQYNNWDRETIEVILPAGISATKVTFKATQSDSNGSNVSDFMMTDVQYFQPLDTDGDGISNDFDLDSDGDECSDAIEGNGVFKPADLVASSMAGGSTSIVDNLGTTIETTDASLFGVPKVNGVAQTQTPLYSILDKINACIDADEDGISDIEDLDDDNDGILDTDEIDTSISYDFSGAQGWASTGNFWRDNGKKWFQINADNANESTLEKNYATAMNLSRVSFAYGWAPAPNSGTVLELLINDVAYAKIVTPSGATNTTYGTVFATVSYSNDAAGVVTEVPNTQYGNWDRETIEVILPAGVSATKVTFKATQADSDGNYVSDFMMTDIQYFKNIDTDGDGISNDFDLDSDGDGCSDAIEGSGNFTSDDLVASSMAGGSTSIVDNLGITVETTDTSLFGVPKVNGLTQVQSTGYSVAELVNACVDTDQDGVSDVVDLDNDNDGILDTDEMNNDVSYDFSGTQGWSSTGNFNYRSDKDWWRINADNTNESTLEKTYTTAMELSRVSFAYGWAPANNSGNTLELLIDDVAYAKIVTPSGATNTAYGTVFAEVSYNNGAAGAVAKIPNSQYDNWDRKTIEVILPAGISATKVTFKATQADSNGSWVSDFMMTDVQYFQPLDTDGDGILNHFDLDSDGDECSDAIEGGEFYMPSDLVASSMPGGSTSIVDNLGTTVETTDASLLGVPKVNGVAKAQTAMYSALSQINACIDADKDGVSDIEDLDDDNDGILDTDEIDMSLSYDFSSEQSWSSTGDFSYRSDKDWWRINGDNNQDATLEKIYATNIDLSKVSFAYGWSPAPNSGITLELLIDDVSYAEIVTPSGATNTSYGTVFATVSYTNGAAGLITKIPNSQYNNWSKETIEVILPVGISATKVTFKATKSDSNGANVSDFMMTDVQYFQTLDTDGDGISNDFDLDSDGDGCSDAIEGNGVFKLSDLVASSMDGGSTSVVDNLGTTVETTDTSLLGVPKVNSVTQTQTPMYSVLEQINACIDADEDGISDIEDLDDDNDAILDIDEMNTSISYDFSGTQGWTSTANFSHDGAKKWYQINADNTNESTLEKTYATAMDLARVSFAYGWAPAPNSGNTLELLVDDISYAKIVSPSGATNTTYGTVFATVSYTNGGAGTVLQVPNSQYGNWDRETIEVILPAGISATKVTFRSTQADSNGANVSDFMITDVQYFQNIDADGDGISNDFDLDSDGDQCPDAIEGDGTFTVEHVITSSMDGGNSGAQYTGTSIQPVQKNLGTTVDTDPLSSTYGVPIVAPATTAVTQGPGSSIYETVEICMDTDSDGISDSEDLDDDNDGILDVDEMNNRISYNFYGTQDWTSTGNFNHDGTKKWYQINADNTNESTLEKTYATAMDLTRVSFAYGWAPAPNSGITLEMLINDVSYAKIVAPSGATNTNYGTAFATVSYTNAAAGTVLQVPNSQYGNWDRETIEVILPAGISATKVTFKATQADSNGANVSDFMITDIQYYQTLDTDNDGISNDLDLDSDGDGCPDALEGNGTFTSSDLVTDTNMKEGNSGAGYIGKDNDGVQENLGTTVDTDTSSPTYGVPIVAPATTAVTQATGSSANENIENCTDSDGDGVSDIYDLDDDNDGILDTIECEKSTNPADFTEIKSSWLGIAPNSTNVNIPATDISSHLGLETGSVLVEVIDGTTYSNGDFSSDYTASTRLKFTGTTPIYLQVKHGPNINGNLSDGIFSNDGISYTYTGNALPSAATFNDSGDQYTVTNTTASTISVNDMYWHSDDFATDVSATCSGDGIYLAYFAIATCADSDNDGISDNLDLDSDGDGCPDAIEGDGNFTSSDLITDTNINGGNSGTGYTGTDNTGVQKNLGATVDTDPLSATYGAPIVSPATTAVVQGVGYSKNSTIEICTDTDGDGVPDSIDIDDDNDGILDTDECSLDLFKFDDSSTSGSGLNNEGSSYTWTLSGGLFQNYYTNEAVSPTYFGARPSLDVTFTKPIDYPVIRIDGINDSDIIEVKVNGVIYPLNNSSASLSPEVELSSVATYNTSEEMFFSGGNLTGPTYGNWAYQELKLLVTDVYSYSVLTKSGQGWGISAFTIDNGEGNCDTDGDGIPNSLDLDSDGDGCPDSMEANLNPDLLKDVTGWDDGTNGSSIDFTKGQVAGHTSTGYGANGLSDVIETDDTSTATVVASQYLTGGFLYNPNALDATINQACKAAGCIIINPMNTRSSIKN